MATIEKTDPKHAALEGTGRLFPDRDPEEISLSEIIRPLIERRKLIAVWTVVAALVAAIVAFLLPVQYTAEAKIMPPQQVTSAATAMLGQLGSLAGLAGKDLGLKNPADLYIGILKSRSIADAIVQQYALQAYYRDKRLSDARKALEKHTEFDTGKDGLISIKFENKDPKRAADVTNAYIDQLYAANRRLAIGEASQRRAFYEHELEAQKDLLADAEVELKKTQESTGLIQLGSQADAIIRSVAQLQAQIAAKQVQLQAMSSFATPENPEFIRTKQEIAALQQQLSNVERNNKLGEGNIAIPTGKIPEAGLEYVRKLREVRYHEQLFEILAKQFEAAKIDEGKSAPLIQVVDAAVVPDKKSGPPRTLIVLVSGFAGFMLCCLYIFIRPSSNNGSKNAGTFIGRFDPMHPDQR